MMYNILQLVVLSTAVLIGNCAISPDADIKIDTTTHRFVDENHRIKIFHGMNAVYKIAPWHPTITGFDTENTLSSIDAKNLKQWGFNVVRLGVMWPGVEPKERGNYNYTYLGQIEKIVNNLAAEDIYTVLDFHQDIWHRKFCGEGVPDYVYETCVAAEPAGTAPFPQPVAAGPYPLDKDGNPSIEACLNQTFAKYYLSAEVGAGFQCLYENKDNLWDAFAGYWKVVAQKFANSPSVIGYELMNEPWAGDVYKHPENLLPGVAEKNYLQPLYEYVHKAIRSVDDEKIIFFEGLTIDYWPIGFTSGPGGSEYNDRQAIAYHIYCPSGSGSIAGEIGCHAIDDEFFYMRRKDVDRIGGGMIMTEFGAIEDEKSELAKLEGNAVLADRYQQSWMYWEFKYFQDITTITPIGESLYTEDGSVSEHKLRILSRTYPMAIAGSDPEYSFNILNGEFSMSYTPLSTVESVSLVGRTTEIYVNQQLFYPNGVNVELSDSVENVLSIQCPEKDSNILTLIQSDSADAKSKSYSIFQKIADYIPWTSASAKDFTVKISPCGRLEKCTCK